MVSSIYFFLSRNDGAPITVAAAAVDGSVRGAAAATACQIINVF